MPVKFLVAWIGLIAWSGVAWAGAPEDMIIASSKAASKEMSSRRKSNRRSHRNPQMILAGIRIRHGMAGIAGGERIGGLTGGAPVGVLMIAGHPHTHPQPIGAPVSALPKQKKRVLTGWVGTIQLVTTIIALTSWHVVVAVHLPRRMRRHFSFAVLQPRLHRRCEAVWGCWRQCELL